MVPLLFYIYTPCFFSNLKKNFFSKAVLIYDGENVYNLEERERLQKMKHFGVLSEFRNLTHVSLFGLHFWEKTFLLLTEKCHGIPGTPETSGHSNSEKCPWKQNR